MPPSELHPPFDYQSALSYLFRDVRYEGRGRKYDDPERSLARMVEILERLGRPQDRFGSLHITGTKGKGSTSAFAEAILRQAGYSTGLFTSPHLHTFRERIRINGELLDGERLARLMERLYPHFEAIPDLTVFDRITALAFQHFADEGIEWAVVEVGLGGRLDSTNVLRPAVCGITRISMDHMHVLGDTLEKIAGEKAGIIKPGTAVFSSPQKEEAAHVLVEVAKTQEAPLTFVEPLQALPLPLAGPHQQVNAAVSVHMVRHLAKLGKIQLDERHIAEGLMATRWPGRFERLNPGLRSEPFILVDCAHNIDSLEILLGALAEHYPGMAPIFLFGVNRDKQLEAMLDRLIEAAAEVILVQSRHPKAMKTQALIELVEDRASGREREMLPVHQAASMEEAVELGRRLSGPDRILVGTGSVFVAAELREEWYRRYPNQFPEDDWVVHTGADPVLVPPSPTGR